MRTMEIFQSHRFSCLFNAFLIMSIFAIAVDDTHVCLKVSRRSDEINSPAAKYSPT